MKGLLKPKVRNALPKASFGPPRQRKLPMPGAKGSLSLERAQKLRAMGVRKMKGAGI